MKNLGLLAGLVIPMTSATSTNDLMITDKQGYIKLPVNTDAKLNFESGDYGTIKVNGKERNAILWKKVRQNYNPNYLPEVKAGEVITWLHISPEKPKVTIDFGEVVAS